MDIPAVRDFKVANTQDASVTVLDYYEPSKCQSFLIELISSAEIGSCVKDDKKSIISDSASGFMFTLSLMIPLSLMILTPK